MLAGAQVEELPIAAHRTRPRGDTALRNVGFNPSQHPLLPVEVVCTSEMRARASADELGRPQRTSFHQIIVCYRGSGVHHVDYNPIDLRAGTVLHVYPGQVQEFQFDQDFEADIVAYRPDLRRTSIPGSEWFPGSDIPTTWNLLPKHCNVAQDSIEELRLEQLKFDGSPAYVVLLESLLASFLARVQLLVAEPAPVTKLPEPYVRFCRFIEERLRERPTITTCASDLGYSTRTLDRACLAAVEKTAKQVLDERTVSEIRRLITDTDLRVTQIGAEFGFIDASSFSKFVQRHLGDSPTNIRAHESSIRDRYASPAGSRPVTTLPDRNSEFPASLAS